jgi:flagellar protein FlgJ
VTEAESNFLKLTVPAARASEQATGIPASITLAQAILESGWGRHMPGNNPFGIKAAHHVAPDSYVARYATIEDGFKAHGCLLAQAPRYAEAMAVRSNPTRFANALQACGYSTNPEYAAMLMQLVWNFDLTQYDAPTGAANSQQLTANS